MLTKTETNKPQSKYPGSLLAWKGWLVGPRFRAALLPSPFLFPPKAQEAHPSSSRHPMHSLEHHYLPPPQIPSIQQQNWLSSARRQTYTKCWGYNREQDRSQLALKELCAERGKCDGQWTEFSRMRQPRILLKPSEQWSTGEGEWATPLCGACLYPIVLGMLTKQIWICL